MHIDTYIHIPYLLANCSVLKQSSASDGCGVTVATSSVYEFLPRLHVCMYLYINLLLCVCMLYVCMYVWPQVVCMSSCPDCMYMCTYM